MRPKQSERLEDIQKKYPDLNLEEIDENLDETEKENIVITLFFSTLNFICNFVIYII